MKTYQTAEIAAIIGIHPNTVRLYEKLELIPKPARQANGYRVFTSLHVEQLRLARLALQIEALQNGLRKKIVQMVKVAAKGNFEMAEKLTREYLEQVRQERAFGEEAIKIVQGLLSGGIPEQEQLFKRKEAAEYLHISMDTLRNWEMNGLLSVKRRQNGYRVYTNADIQRLKIIRSLRCANYSLQAILRMLCQLSCNSNTDIQHALNTPDEKGGIIAVCDKLLTSLCAAERNAMEILKKLQLMKKEYS